MKPHQSLPIVIALSALPCVQAGPATEASARLLAQAEPRIKAIYEKDEFRMRTFEATWLPDGSGYLKLETPAGAADAVIASYDAASGQRTVVVASGKLPGPNNSARLTIRGFVRAPSGRRILLRTGNPEDTQGRDHGLYEPESELWDPVNGEQRALPQFECGNGLTRVPMEFDAFQSFFVHLDDHWPPLQGRKQTSSLRSARPGADRDRRPMNTEVASAKRYEIIRRRGGVVIFRKKS
jgi:hypothetical protein